ncbi:integrase arm-type DNA-binding domain-containing protein [Sulfitobacter sp. Ks41]|uniref:tyrosine-type recombinase/integrase n=1 Tax=Sulfitobacter sp. Ks41 TaxID=2731139 RepID=UPI0023E0EB78|nr:site-specific integrase [Sulfitobacter sp. Ks41]MDF3360053.1 integrase arm-type DNA-binding domain-containing protein [Sulfitobacter sp. Ks41]
MDGSFVDQGWHGKKPGPHVEKRLIAAFVRRAPPGRHTDGGGLYLQVDRSGARRWMLRIVVHGKRRDFGLGSAKLVSLAEAREKAHEHRMIARSGGNPAVQSREAQGKSVTFAELAHAVHQRKFKDNTSNGKHVAQWINTLETYAFPVIGALAVEDIHQDDLERVLDPIWTAKPETARRVLQRIKTIFDHACGRGLRTKGNPATGMKTLMREQNAESKHFAAVSFMEINDIVPDLDKSRDIGALALIFTILTAMRSGPIRSARWSEFDAGLQRWTVPSEKMKTRKRFVVPISMAARSILLRAQEHRTRASDLVFPSPSNPMRMISDATMRKLLQSKYPGATVHGMRTTFRTWAAEVARADHDVAELCLAHKVGSRVAQIYNQAELFDHRLMLMEKWGLWVYSDLEPFSNGNDVEAIIRGRWTETGDGEKVN